LHLYVALHLSGMAGTMDTESQSDRRSASTYRCCSSWMTFPHTSPQCLATPGNALKPREDEEGVERN
jgi:hypothetical protein